MVREMHPAEEVYAGRQSFNIDFIRMEKELESLIKKLANLENELF